MFIINSIRSFFSEMTYLVVSLFLTGLFLFVLMSIALFSFGYLGYVSYSYFQEIHMALSVVSSVVIFYLFWEASKAIYASWDWVMTMVSNWFE